MNTFAFILSPFVILYSLGCWYLRYKNKYWPFWRLVAFNFSILALVIVLSPSLLHWAHYDFRVHMIVHLIAGMIAPLGLVMSSPVSLMLKCLPRSFGRCWVWFVALLPVRLLSHPATALLLNVGGMYVLYMTELYDYILQSPNAAFWVHWHFLLAGCLFTWTIAGPDPAPHRPALWLRASFLFIAMVAHAVLAKWMYQFHFPLGMPIKEVRQGAELMFYIGELVEIILMYRLVRQWLQTKIPTPMHGKMRGSGSVIFITWDKKNSLL